MGEIEKWFSDPIVTRDGASTVGIMSIKGATRGPLMPIHGLPLPRRVNARCPGYVRLADKTPGWLMVAATGTGVQYRIPIIFTDAMLAEAGAGSRANDFAEIETLKRAMAEMEKMLAEHMTGLGYDIAAYKVEGAAHDPWTQDCVDQACNGTSYAVILQGAGLMKFFRPYHPGYKGGLHYYTRLQRVEDGRILAFDLYHRGAGIGKGNKPITAWEKKE